MPWKLPRFTPLHSVKYRNDGFLCLTVFHLPNYPRPWLLFRCFSPAIEETQQFATYRLNVGCYQANVDGQCKLVRTQIDLFNDKQMGWVNI